MGSHPTIPDDILAAAENLIPQMDAEPSRALRGSMVYYAAMAIKQERERCAKIADRLTEAEKEENGYPYHVLGEQIAMAILAQGE